MVIPTPALNWPSTLPKKPEDIRPEHLASILNEYSFSVHRENCRAFVPEYGVTMKWLTELLADLLRVRERDRVEPAQHLAFLDVWAGYNSLLAAATILRAGYPNECYVILRSALLSLFQAIHYCNDEEVFEKLKEGAPLKSKDAINFAKEQLIITDAEGNQVDAVGSIWGHLSTHYVHASTGMAIHRRCFSGSSDDRKDLQIGPRAPSGSTRDRESFTEATTFLNHGIATYLIGLRHIFPFLPPIEGATGYGLKLDAPSVDTYLAKSTR